MELTIPEGAERILKRLNESGEEAYIAGGAVRDLIMNRTPHNYDIAASISTDRLKTVFRNTMPDKKVRNRVTVVESKTGYDVICCNNPAGIKENCGRRDFTINSIIYSPNSGITDYYGGCADIEAGIIRCTGDAEHSFRTDPLRMLRAVRFSAVLEFEIEKQTAAAIKKCAVYIKKISGSRLRDELNKILLSEHPDYIRKLHELGLLIHIIPELEKCFGEPQKNKYHIYDVGEHIMHTVTEVPQDIVLRWAALLHDVGKPCCPSIGSNGIIHFYGHHRESRRIAVDVLYRLHMDPDMIKDIALLVENHDYRVDANYTSVKRMMSKTGAELFEKLMLLQKADNKAKSPKHFPEKLKRINGGLNIYRQVIASNQPYRISDLMVNGRDLMNIGCRQGRESGDMLKALLDEVIIKPELNNRAYLFKRAKEMRRARGK